MNNIFLKKCIFSAILGLVSVGYSQVNLSDYHQFNQSFKTRFNPAMYDGNSANMNIALMNIAFGLHSTFKYSDLIQDGIGIYADSLVFNFPKFRNAAKENNYISMGSDLTVFQVSFKTGSPKEDNQFQKPHQISVGLRARVISDINFNNDFITLFTQGNLDAYSTLMSGSLGVNTTMMREFSISHGRKISNRLWAGLNFKYLQGLYNVTTKFFDLDMQAVEDRNYIEVSTRAEFLVSGPVNFTYDAYQFVEDTNFTNPNYGLSDWLFSSGNPGYAVDLGIVYQPFDKLLLSCSVTDLGNIQWQRDSKILNQNTTYRYTPADLSNSYDENADNYKTPEDVFGEIRESFKESFKVYETQSSYQQQLPYQIYLGMHYDIGSNSNLGLVYTKQVSRNFEQELLTASLNVLLLDALSLSGTIVVDEDVAYFGMGGNLSLGPLQLSMSLNNIQGVIDPANVNNIAFHFGLQALL